MSERGVHPFTMGGSTRCYTAWPMAFAGQHRCIGRPEIGIRDRTLTIHGRQRVPEFLRGGLITLANGNTDDLAGVPIQVQPDPLLRRFFLDKGPQFVTFQGQSPFFWDAQPQFVAQGRIFCCHRIGATVVRPWLPAQCRPRRVSRGASDPPTQWFPAQCADVGGWRRIGGRMPCTSIEVCPREYSSS